MSIDVKIFSGRSFRVVRGNKYDVEVSGSKEEKDSISCKRHDDGLVIRQTASETSCFSGNISGSNNVFISIKNVVINGNSFSGNTKPSTLDVVVTVPDDSVDMTLDINGFYEDISICDAGEIEILNRSSSSLVFGNSKDATINLTSSGNISGGNVQNAKISLHGSGNISVNSVKGQVKVNLQGSGDVKIKDGVLTNVDVNLQGSGDVRVAGSVSGDIDANVMGSGDIKIKVAGEMPARIKKNSMGSGDIKIKPL